MGCALLIAILSTISTCPEFVKELNLIGLREEFVTLTLIAATEAKLVITLQLHVKRTTPVPLETTAVTYSVELEYHKHTQCQPAVLWR